jgi:hypothetical protein
MEVFDIKVDLKTDQVKLFVVPFEVQSAAPTIGYLLVRNKESLGSIFLGANYQWTTKETLPWSTGELQLIGKEIESHYFLLQD